jgi:hypothetical protein
MGPGSLMGSGDNATKGDGAVSATATVRSMAAYGSSSDKDGGGGGGGDNGQQQLIGLARNYRSGAPVTGSRSGGLTERKLNAEGEQDDVAAS